MARLTVALDPTTHVSPSAFADAWNTDSEALDVGPAKVETSRGEVMLPGLVEFVVIPLAVNLAAAAIIALIQRVAKPVTAPKSEVVELEITEVNSANGDRVVVVRARRERPSR